MVFIWISELSEESYRVGRSPVCEFQISENDIGVTKFPLISKIHFKLQRSIVDDKQVVYLEDVSSNGTFVNEVLVGKHNRILLQNSAEISLATPLLKSKLIIYKISIITLYLKWWKNWKGLWQCKYIPRTNGLML